MQILPLPLPLPPLSLFGSRFISRAVKTESPLPLPSSVISLLRNQRETLATQAECIIVSGLFSQYNVPERNFLA